MNTSLPEKSGSGVYVQVPSVVQATVPCAASGARLSTTSGSPSSSVSPSRTSTSPKVSSATVRKSSSAAGCSFVAVIVTVTVPTSVPPFPSEIVYVNESEPKKPRSVGL